jgi:hypothetical protein
VRICPERGSRKNYNRQITALGHNMRLDSLFRSKWSYLCWFQDLTERTELGIRRREEEGGYKQK